MTTRSPADLSVDRTHYPGQADE